MMFYFVATLVLPLVLVQTLKRNSVGGMRIAITFSIFYKFEFYTCILYKQVMQQHVIPSVKANIIKHTVYWEIFKVQNFRGWVPFANKFSRMTF